MVSVNLNSLFGVLFGRQGQFGPPRYSTWDRAAAQRSIMILAALEPRVVATGDGKARVDEAARALHRLAQRQDRPARWRQGFFSGVDYSDRIRYRPPPPLYQRVQKRLGPFLISRGVGPKDVVVLEVPGRRQTDY